MGLLDHRLVERGPHAAGRTRRLDPHREHRPLADHELAGAQPLERVVERAGLDAGQVAHLAAVDAEHRHVGVGDEIHRAQHRAVAAEGEDRVERAVDRILGLADVPDVDAVGRAPLVGVTDQAVGLGAVGMGHDAEPADRRHDAASGGATASRRSAVIGAPVRAARARNSTLPSAPVSGERSTSVTTSPCPAETLDHLTQHRPAHGRVADDATAAHPAAPGLELRLDQQHERRRRDGEAHERRRDRPQRDEREVGDRELGRTARERLEVPEVGPFHHHDARVVAQRPRQLAVSDVDRDHGFRAALAQAVGEPAGGRTGVEHAGGRARRSPTLRARRRASRRRATRSAPASPRPRRPRPARPGARRPSQGRRPRSRVRRRSPRRHVPGSRPARAGPARRRADGAR